LRNSQKESAGGGATDAGAPSPYLRLTTRDEGSQDTLPDISKDVTPLSQEAQLMSISHMLTQLHADFAYITASNPMDMLFLAKSLHRSNPDTRLVLEPDLLLQREGDDQPYIGTLSVTPYPLVWLARSPELPGRLRAFASGQTEAYYNAASFTLGEMAKSPGDTKAPGQTHPPLLYGYRGDPRAGGTPTAPKLWLTTAGSDGYYPLAMLDTESGLPAEPQAKADSAITIHPSHVWQALCALVGLGCLLHIGALCSANYASPSTCDLDLRENCMQHRRALYGQVGGAALFLLSIAVALPATVFVGRHAAVRLDRANLIFALAILLLAICEWLVAIGKTFRALRWDSNDTSSLFLQSETRVCAVLYWGAILATLGLAAMWLVLCVRHGGGQRLGAFFSYRCLHPLSGVSPLAPTVLLLWGWFFWALLHAKRLRLAMNCRPQLPDAVNFEKEPCLRQHKSQPDMFVSDARMRSGLLQDTTCLMISRRLLQRIFRADRAPHTKLLDGVLMLFLGGLTILWIGLCPMHALDHFGDRVGPTTLYELFIGLLLVPLLLLAMCAAARLFLMSAAMRAHLLEPLERMPMRQAFTRLQDFHWVTMLRESGQLERWRDMSRSTEGIRQILNDPDLPEACRTGRLTEQKEALEAEIAELQQHVRALRENGPQPDAPKRACEYMQDIEQRYAACAESILCCILLPYWLEKRHNLMQSTGPCADDEPNVVLLAEEFLAIRYVAFIRGVLAQMRYLLLFITVALVLVMLAINSYPFQPKQEIAWVVTGLFLAFSVGIIVALAQMHRNPLLSRITDKEAHALGATFYLRVAGFGAVPLITWLATQYPSIGGMLYSIVKPGLDVMK
jgi:DNA-binding transcriptional MerR regulator